LDLIIILKKRFENEHEKEGSVDGKEWKWKNFHAFHYLC